MSKILMGDYTPGPVALQGARAVSNMFLENPPARILDPSAGSGVFGQVFRQVWPKARTHAIEPKAVEAWFLSCNYDSYEVNRFEDASTDQKYDLVLTNPPFHSWEEFLIRALSVVVPGGYVVFYGLTAWGARSESGYLLFADYPPAGQLRVPGAVSHRVKGNDTRDYCWWVFRRTHEHETNLNYWATFNLPRLPGHERKWTDGVRPGRQYGAEFQTSEA